MASVEIKEALVKLTADLQDAGLINVLLCTIIV